MENMRQELRKVIRNRLSTLLADSCPWGGLVPVPGVLGAASTRALLLGLVESPGRILRLPPPQMLKLDEVAPLVLQLNARAPPGLAATHHRLE